MAFKFNASFIAGFFSAFGLTCGSLAVEGKAAPLITIGNPYRHFQHQAIKANGEWSEKADFCCFATSAATVAMSIADNNVGITLNGFNNTNLGAEAFEASYRIRGTSGKVANGVKRGPLWLGDGNWVGAPWFQGPNANRLRVKDFYLGDLVNWKTIPETLPTLNVVGAFALVDAIAPLRPRDVEWWDYHVVGVYSFDFDVRSMEITDSNKDDRGAEYIDGKAVHAVGGNILKGAGVLDSLTWQENGILTNADGNGMDNEKLISLRVLYLQEVQEVPGPLPVAGAVVAFGWARKLRRRLHDRE